MSKGHIYFEIQADDSKRAIDFYSQVFAWKFPQIKGLPVPYWTIETGGSRGGLLQRPANPPAPMRYERVCLLARGGKFRRNRENDIAAGGRRRPAQIRSTRYVLAGLLRGY
jgi:hypothetical protein